MRVESANSAKMPRKRGTYVRREPQFGTHLRELWDLLHVYRGEPIILNVHERFGHRGGTHFRLPPEDMPVQGLPPAA